MTGRCAAFPALALAGALVAVALPAPIPAPIIPGSLFGVARAEQNRGRRGVRVELRREKTGFSYLGETDADGFYLIVARLGDESADEPLQLRAERQAMTLTVRFDPADHATERGTRVDFTARRPVESPTAFAGTLKRYLAQ